MSAQNISSHEALLRLGASAAEAVAQVLDTLLAGAVSRGEVTVIDDGVSLLSTLVPGSVVTSISYAGGLGGGNFLVVAPQAARALANAMRGAAPEPSGDEGDELSERELSAAAEVGTQAVSAAARAMGLVLGHELETSAAETRMRPSPDAATDGYGSTPYATSTTFLIAGEPCRLIQLVPEQFVVRMERTLDALAETARDDAASVGARPVAASTLGVHDALSGVNLRVWAELGRTRLPLGSALALPPGAVVDLDCAPDDPIELFVNGVRFARGHLLVTDDGEWAIVIDELAAGEAPAGPASRATPTPQTRPRVAAAL